MLKTETSCAKYTNIMHKIHNHYPQNAQMSCTKYRNVMQNAKCRDVMLKMQKH